MRAEQRSPHPPLPPLLPFHAPIPLSRWHWIAGLMLGTALSAVAGVACANWVFEQVYDPTPKPPTLAPGALLAIIVPYFGTLGAVTLGLFSIVQTLLLRHHIASRIWWLILGVVGGPIIGPLSLIVALDSVGVSSAAEGALEQEIGTFIFCASVGAAFGAMAVVMQVAFFPSLSRYAGRWMGAHALGSALGWWVSVRLAGVLRGVATVDLWWVGPLLGGATAGAVIALITTPMIIGQPMQARDP